MFYMLRTAFLPLPATHLTYFVIRFTETSSYKTWKYEEDLVVDNGTWNRMINKKTKRPKNSKYVPYFTGLLKKDANVTCVLYVKSCYFTRKGITIHFYCKHKTCNRKYYLVNEVPHPDKQVFAVKHTGEINHVPEIRVASVTNLNAANDSEISEILKNIKQEDESRL